MKILGIETSCDETSASVVTSSKQILSNVIISQIAEHQEFGGVVPEIASRAHLSYLQEVVINAMKEANLSYADLDAIAVTAGPGLVGGLLVGITFAQGLSYIIKKPVIAINHLEGHALTARLTNEVQFPYLTLLVSGGHCQILIVENVGVYHKLGGTLDDAVGESFDKVAKMLGLDYPGGPIVEKMAIAGDQKRYVFPQAMKGRLGCDFSFSGLKTAVRQVIAKTDINEKNISDLCASFQYTVSEILIDRVKNAVNIAKGSHPEIKQLVIAGGVAANQYLFKKLQSEMITHNLQTIAPPIKLCTDNAAMIAWAGVERMSLGLINTPVMVRPRWPLGSS